MWNPFATNRQVGRARQVANEHRVRVQELEEALGALLLEVQSLPVAIEWRPSTQARTLIRDGYPVPIRFPALADPGAPIHPALKRAQEVMGL